MEKGYDHLIRGHLDHISNQLIKTIFIDLSEKRGRLRRGSVRSRLRLEVALPSLNREHGIAANTQLALAA